MSSLGWNCLLGQEEVSGSLILFHLLFFDLSEKFIPLLVTQNRLGEKQCIAKGNGDETEQPHDRE